MSIELNLTLQANSVEVNENSPLTFTVSATDVNTPAQPLTYTAHLVNDTALPAGASFDGNTGIFSWTPGYDQGRDLPYRIVIGVTNGILSTEKTVEVVVKNVNRAPVMVAIGDQSIQAGKPLDIPVLASDPDGDAVEISAEPMPEEAKIANGHFLWTPRLDQAGVYNLVFKAKDSTLSASQAVKIEVVKANQAPVKAAQLSEPAFAGGKFGMDLVGDANQSYTIEATTDFVTWTAIGSVTTDGSGQTWFTDASGSGFRFYRAVVR